MHAARLLVISRIAAAVFGGYALSHTLPIALAAAFPMARAEAALFAIQGSFLVYTAAVLWAFTARSVFTQSALAERATADAKSWGIEYPMGRNAPHLNNWWESRAKGWEDQVIDSATGEALEARDTSGGQTLYSMHCRG